MSTSDLWTVVMVVWIASAIGLGIVMGRRGYSAFGWGVIGGVLGPIGILLALLLHLPEAPDHWTSVDRPAAGSVDVLVGTDGSGTSLAAAFSAVDLLGERLGRLTLAAVAPRDANATLTERAQSDLATAAAAVNERLRPLEATAGTVILHGRPADALRARAEAGGYDVIAVGSHGHGASTALLGSVAASLVDGSPVPVLVFGRTTGGAHGSPHGVTESVAG